VTQWLTIKQTQASFCYQFYIPAASFLESSLILQKSLLKSQNLESNPEITFSLLFLSQFYKLKQNTDLYNRKPPEGGFN
jgi:hypothetical protein